MEPFTLVIFGGTGDLSRRKLLPALFHLYQDQELSKGFSILCFARTEMADEAYRNLVQEAIKTSHKAAHDRDPWTNFSRNLFYLSGKYEEDESYARLCQRIDQVGVAGEDGSRNVIYYLAVPPEVTPAIVRALEANRLCRERFKTRVVVEKPFGRDRPSAADLNRILRTAFDERQIYRIDHYLGKETVQNIAFFRFSNSIFEQLWNRYYIDNVQITVAEQLGIGHRGGFYEPSGVVRDIVQNHILQLLSLVAMEPPISFEADFFRDEKQKVFLSIQPAREEDIDQLFVRGQYGPGKGSDSDTPGYRGEEGVLSHSNTPTFFAGKFYVANWRWSGVPFYVRTGKRMAKQVTEIAIEFKRPPLRLLGGSSDLLESNILLLTIQPDEKISLRFNVKYPYSIDRIYSANMVLDYQETFKTTPHPPYERLLIDCMKGDLTLFAREDSVETMWGIVDPIIAHWENFAPRGFPNYAAGSWGPTEADFLVKRDGRRWNTT